MSCEHPYWWNDDPEPDVLEMIERWQVQMTFPPEHIVTPEEEEAWEHKITTR